ncbi:hypothetical protein [Flavobacterium collinsii]|jgi:hypothetical protein|uniref:Uncharacterized protein n=1 Tax=Flavobacterium collinsii TaxID=1114861 RepID=A0ABM8KG54_9FLAO|nr:hypothetical protein [Flavobacterium collinsii]CAA9196755.1 hypothetical protein FLACOL7796_01325 [Flavobacterium collinsii]
MYSEEELKDQEKVISNVLGYVFLPLFFFVIIGGYFVENSNEYIERQYKEANEYSFSGVVYEKKIEGGEGYRFPHYLFLNTGIRWKVSSLLYDKIQIGDSVVKRSKSDSVFYYMKKKNQIIIEDENFYLREKYFAKLKQE